jgi:hypothetical protein
MTDPTIFLHILNLDDHVSFSLHLEETRMALRASFTLLDSKAEFKYSWFDKENFLEFLDRSEG